MRESTGEVEEAGPSIAVQMVGLNAVPVAGDEFSVCSTEQEVLPLSWLLQHWSCPSLGGRLLQTCVAARQRTRLPRCEPSIHHANANANSYRTHFHAICLLMYSVLQPIA